MNRLSLVVSPSAQQDLRYLLAYSREHWGEARSAEYLEYLKQRMAQLLDLPLLGSPRADLLPGIRSLSSKSHIVFYRVSETRVEIVRILSARQDPLPLLT